MSEIVIYTDGACSGNPGPGGWGTVVIYPDGRLRELGGGEARTTNNRMELLAAIKGLEEVRMRPEPVLLYTDSTYVVNGATKWVAGWRRKGWRTSEGGPVLNQELWERLDALASARKGRLTWGVVKGHSGHECNERCDAIAVAFSRRESPKLHDGPAVGCGYSLLPPTKDLIRDLTEKPSSPKAKKGGIYLSYVDGKLERHATWAACAARVQGVSKARFKKVSSPEEEAATLRSWGAA